MTFANWYAILFVLLTVSVLLINARSAWILIHPERHRYNMFANITKTLIDHDFDVMMFAMSEYSNHNINEWLSNDDLPVSFIKCGAYDRSKPPESFIPETYSCMWACLSKEEKMPRPCKGRTYNKPDILIFDCLSFAGWDFAHAFQIPHLSLCPTLSEHYEFSNNKNYRENILEFVFKHLYQGLNWLYKGHGNQIVTDIVNRIIPQSFLQNSTQLMETLSNNFIFGSLIPYLAEKSFHKIYANYYLPFARFNTPRSKYLAVYVADHPLMERIRTHYLLYTSPLGVLEYNKPSLPGVAFIGHRSSITKVDKKIWAWVEERQKKYSTMVYINLKDTILQRQVINVLQSVATKNDLSIAYITMNTSQPEPFKFGDDHFISKRELPPTIIGSEGVELVISDGNLYTVGESITKAKIQLIIPDTPESLAVAERVTRNGAGLYLYPRELTSSAIEQALERLIVKSNEVYQFKASVKELSRISRLSRDDFMSIVDEVINIGEGKSKLKLMIPSIDLDFYFGLSSAVVLLFGIIIIVWNSLVLFYRIMFCWVPSRKNSIKMKKE